MCAVPSGRLTESCSVKEGTGVMGSAPGSPGDGSRDEETEGMVLRRRSSERQTAHQWSEPN